MIRLFLRPLLHYTKWHCTTLQADMLPLLERLGMRFVASNSLAGTHTHIQTHTHTRTHTHIHTYIHTYAHTHTHNHTHTHTL
jgi:hypothetical protein